jgi:UDP-glucose 4-epimerase
MSRAASPERIMVLGGAGFLGSHLVDRLLAEGRTVDVVDDLSTGSLANLNAARGAGAGVRFHHLDISGTDFPSVVEHRRPQVVIDLASFGSGRTHTGAAGSFAAVVGVAAACRAAGVDKVILTVPAAELYGVVALRDVPVKESQEHRPVDVLGVAAKAAVEVLSVERDRTGLDYTALALADVYGPRQRSGALADVVAAVVGATPGGPPDHRRTFDLVYVDDVVDAIVRTLDRASGLVLNIGTGVMSTVGDIVRAARGVDDTGGITRGLAAPARFAVSPMRARIHLSWAPWTSLSEGLAAIHRAAP